jgi:drug/metabolite transporter (DMT)-like permease
VRVLAAFLIVYVIWGSTYLAIRFADETMPPFLMAATRFLLAGAVMYGWLRLRGAQRPTWVHWKSALIVGGLLLFCGNGGVVWAEQTLPSSLAALLVSTVPIWMALLGWLIPGGGRPSWKVGAGLALGFAGVALLVGGVPSTGAQAVNPVGIAVVLVAAVAWASGSLYSRVARFPSSPLLGTGMEMLAGGTLLLVAGLVTGEAGRIDAQAISAKSLLALGFLIVFGSLVAYTAYIWLLRVSTPARVSTYAYVNPVVAVFLGWAFDHEPVTGRTLLAAAVIVAAVVVITTMQASASRKEREATLDAATEAEPVSGRA